MHRHSIHSTSQLLDATPRGRSLTPWRLLTSLLTLLSLRRIRRSAVRLRRQTILRLTLILSLLGVIRVPSRSVFRFRVPAGTETRSTGQRRVSVRTTGWKIWSSSRCSLQG